MQLSSESQYQTFTLASSPKRVHLQKEYNKSLLKSDHLSHLPLYKRIDIFHCFLVFVLPIIALYGLYSTPKFHYQTIIFALVFFFFSILGISAGYHRLYSHASYVASFPLEIFLMVTGSAALQGSIKWWSLLHRTHHLYTDTDDDPYNAQRGFFYSHVGWLLLRNIRVKKYLNMEDLCRNRIVSWQNRNYLWFAPFMAFAFPPLVSWLFWNDFRGGFYIAGILRLVLAHHCTWCVNSVAHYFGEKTFDDTISPRDSFFTAIITMGEGYHNFHHEFPHDYRNGIHWYDYDPTKWFIYWCSKLGLAHDLNTFSKNEIERGQWEMRYKAILKEKSEISFGVDIESLPIWSKSDMVEYCNDGKHVCIVFMNVVYDVSEFIGKHPGGRAILLSRNMKDVTLDMNGRVYNHTNAARNMMAHMRVAKLVMIDEVAG